MNDLKAYFEPEKINQLRHILRQLPVGYSKLRKYFTHIKRIEHLSNANNVEQARIAIQLTKAQLFYDTQRTKGLKDLEQFLLRPLEILYNSTQDQFKTNAKLLKELYVLILAYAKRDK